MKTILLILFYLIALVIVLHLTGCQPTDEVILMPIDRPFEVLVTKINWLATVAIVGIALSVVAFINGSKAAIPVFVGCCTALGVTLAVIKFAGLIAVASLCLAGGLCIYTILVRTRALKELVRGGEKVKAWLDKSEDRESFNEIHRNTQSDTTQTLVKKVKNGDTITSGEML
jgi:hypothetical protein